MCGSFGKRASFWEEAIAALRWHPHLGDVVGLSCAQWLETLPPAPPIRASIVLASEERSGSEWLCQLMGATGRLGRPMEYLNPHWNSRFLADYPHDIPAEVRIAHRAGVTSNGVFAMKLHVQHFDRLKEHVRLGDVFPAPVFVRLSRRDRLGQAISRYRAQQTARYHSHWIEERPGAGYDAAAIERTLSELVALSGRWELYFARNGLEPLRLAYEELSADPRGALQAIAALVGEHVEASDVTVDRELEVQRDETTEEWRRRFLADMKNIDRFD